MTGLDDPGEGVARSLDDLAVAPSGVTIGFYDGVHRGHQAIIERARAEARRREIRALALTFDRHPREVVRPATRPRLLMTRERRVRTLLGTGLDDVVELPFTPALSRLEPHEFVERILVGALRARAVVVGANFRFGHEAAGDVATLEELGARHGFAVTGVELIELDGGTVSSTEIRDRVEAGDVAWAARALGRPHVVDGTVVRGEGRGRSIGVPTANVAVGDRLVIPARGVYAGHAEVGDEVVPAVINVGTRPTFDRGEAVTVEAHLLDTERDLYGQDLGVRFAHRLRDERRFESADELVAQIRDDIARGRELLAVDPT